MHELMIFENEEFGKIRTLLIDGEPWFVGKDAAEILGYSNTETAYLNMWKRKIGLVSQFTTAGKTE
ncbi:BRO family protein [Anaerotignum sp.]|uniref:BRO family protein n=1 Tax=Anaerotignum sp. TaxID=2039241 RepID=UPI0028989E34|nr:BRO family protein [Anaerotignum sp.]